MKRWFFIGLVMIAVQCILIGLYWRVEQGRSSLSAAAPERLREPAPAFIYKTSQGTSHTLESLHGRPVLLHFWATWCPPCKEELPTLLALADDDRFVVLAVALDPDWDSVRHFTGEDLPPCVVHAESAAVERAFGVRTLPETLLVDSAGTIRLRFSGARDWTSGPVLKALFTEIETE